MTASPTCRLPLQPTGSRMLPGHLEENYWFRRHQAAYEWFLPFTRGAVVVDAGCGEGYGAALLARDASRVVALDRDGGVASQVRQRYPGLDVCRGDARRLPVASASVEVVVALQVVEHLDDQAGFLAECARVLRPAGTLLLTTPNRLTFPSAAAATAARRGDGFLDRSPVNPFPTRELAPGELRELLEAEFDVRRLWGLRHGRRLQRVARRHGDLVAAQLSSPADNWSAGLLRRVADVRTKDFVISPKSVERSLDLVAVAVRRPPPPAASNGSPR